MTNHDNSHTSLLREGAVLFNHGEYWMAHEAWETVWKSLNGPARKNLQGLIQSCGCFFHLQQNRQRPALALGHLALEKLRSPCQAPLIRIQGLEELLQVIVNENNGVAVQMAKQNQLWVERAKILVAQVIRP